MILQSISKWGESAKAQFLQEDEIITLYVAIQRLAQSGVEWSSNAKYTKRMHGNISP